MEIRLIKDDEIERALSIMKESFHPSYASIFFLKKEYTLVALIDDEVVGAINMDVFSAKVKVGYLAWLYVDKKFRGQNIAKNLTEKGIEYLEKNIGVDIVCSVIEGDNPSSFKTISSLSGFRILSFYDQVKIFGFSFLKVWKKFSHFFDMGYFIWGKINGDKTQYYSLDKGFTNSLLSFTTTILLNSLLFLIILLKLRLPLTLLLFPLFLISVRTLIQVLVLKLFKIKTIYLSWSSSYFTSILSSIFLPLYFISPGGIYPYGDKWSMKTYNKALGISSLSVIIFEAIFLIVTTIIQLKSYIIFALLLFISDSMLFFYPFSGFLSSRIKRYYKKGYIPIFIISFVILILIVFFTLKC